MYFDDLESLDADLYKNLMCVCVSVCGCVQNSLMCGVRAQRNTMCTPSTTITDRNLNP